MIIIEKKKPKIEDVKPVEPPKMTISPDEQDEILAKFEVEPKPLLKDFKTSKPSDDVIVPNVATNDAKQEEILQPTETKKAKKKSTKPKAKKEVKVEEEPKKEIEVEETPKRKRVNKVFNKAQNDMRSEFEETFDHNQTLPAPDDLDPKAHTEWERIMLCYAQLPKKILSNLDETMLRLFCESKSRYENARDVYQKVWGECIFTDDDRVQRQINQAIKIMHQETEIMNRLAASLCLTPQGRAKSGFYVAESLKQEEDDVNKLLDFIKG